MWTLGGEIYEWSPDWLQGWAAILQAVLSGLAVWAAVKLQDRSTQRREMVAHRTRLEGVATVAVWVWGVFQDVADRANDKAVGVRNIRFALREADFKAALNAMQGFPLVDVGDVILIQQMIVFRSALLDVSADIEAALDLGKRSGDGLVFSLAPFVDKHRDSLGEACMAIEQTVALYAKRPALL